MMKDINIFFHSWSVPKLSTFFEMPEKEGKIVGLNLVHIKSTTSGRMFRYLYNISAFLTVIGLICKEITADTLKSFKSSLDINVITHSSNQLKKLSECLEIIIWNPDFGKVS